MHDIYVSLYANELGRFIYLFIPVFINAFIYLYLRHFKSCSS